VTDFTTTDGAWSSVTFDLIHSLVSPSWMTSRSVLRPEWALATRRDWFHGSDCHRS
jgi:hypothetical protein